MLSQHTTPFVQLVQYEYVLARNFAVMLDFSTNCVSLPPPMGWQDQAFCIGTNTDWFIDGWDEAVRICGDCPVKKQCLEYALETDSVGVWGGTTDAEREELRKRDSLLDGEITVVWEKLE